MSRRTVTNFTGGSFSQREGKAARAANEVPEGTVTEVVDWAGDDPERAQRALDAENKHDEPRKGVTEKLEHVLESADEE